MLNVKERGGELELVLLNLMASRWRGVELRREGGGKSGRFVGWVGYLWGGEKGRGGGKGEGR